MTVALFRSFPSCTWERPCSRNSVAAFPPPKFRTISKPLSYMACIAYLFSPYI
jgi:hypothetical protein